MKKNINIYMSQFFYLYHFKFSLLKLKLSLISLVREKRLYEHSWVQLEYTGSFENGEVFDTNIGKDRPLVVQMSMKEVIPGFEQGIIGTTKGAKRKN